MVTALLGAVVLALGAGGGCRSSSPFDPESDSWQHTLAEHSLRPGAGLDAETTAYLEQVEAALALRAEAIQFASGLQQKLARHEPLSGAELDQLNRGTIRHLESRAALLEVAQRHESWLHVPDELMHRHGITPEQRFHGVLISMSAALVLYDNYALALSIYENDRQLRRILNRRDEGYRIARDELKNVSLSYHSASKRQRVRDALRFYEEHRDALLPGLRGNPDVAYLDALIQSSPSYTFVRYADPVKGANAALKFYRTTITDFGRGIRDVSVGQFSGAFGNMTGIIETRKGYMHGNPAITAAVKRSLRAGDILLEKTPFRLTDKLIPGYWGHVGIWLGTETELRDVGLWEHPLVKKYHAAIRDERLVVEALRPGVQMNTLEHFLNIDDMAALRDPTVQSDPELLKTRLLLTLRQVGKKFDFNFDVQTTDRIVCSEICYVTITDIDWRTEAALGRATISPDNVAAQAINGRLEVVLLYHRAKPIDGDRLGYMRSLME